MKKYLLKSSDGYGNTELYYKGFGKGLDPDARKLVRIVPSSTSIDWNIPTGIEGETLLALEDDGNFNIKIKLGGREITLDPVEIANLENALRLLRQNSFWEADEIEEMILDVGQEVEEFYE